MKTERYYFWISVLGHLILLGAVWAMSVHSSSRIWLEQAEAQNSMTVSLSAIGEMHRVNTLRVFHHTVSHLVIPRQTVSTKQMIHHSITINKVEKTLSHSGRASAFLTILHQIIFSKELYPETALVLHQKGRVTVGMLIDVKGNITRVSVLKSSGFDSLDQAALDAVSAANPIVVAEKYLQQAEYFSVTVVFS